MADRPPSLVTASPTPSSGRWAQALGGAAWAATALIGVTALSQAVGVTGLTITYVLQALTPFLLSLAVPLAILAMWRDRHLLAVTNAGIAVALLVLTAPVVFHPDPARVPALSPRLTIAHANAYFRNTTPLAAAKRLLALDADVLAITEYDDDLSAALSQLGIDGRFPHRVDRAPTNRNGVALFSRFPIDRSALEPIGGQLGIDATLDVNGTPLRVIVVHPLPGIDRGALRQWRRDLAEFGTLATSPGPPTVMVGDFNASRWHPAFRALLDRGLTDAHEQLGDGFGRSWPNGSWIPRFVRLDHALLGDGLVATRVVDVNVPGSDHLGFLVEVAIIRR